MPSAEHLLPFNIQVEVRIGARILHEQILPAHRPFRVGRSPECEIHITAREISRHHATITPNADGFIVEDLSLNGVLTGFENDRTIPYGTPVTVGSFSLLLWRLCTTDAQSGFPQIRKEALARLIEQVEIDASGKSSSALTSRVEGALERILYELGIRDSEQRNQLRAELRDEALGLGPLEPLLKDDHISEIMVVSRDAIYVEERGRLRRTDLVFSSEDSVRTIIDRIITPLGRRIDESSPMVDARLEDGSRVNAVIPPLSLKGSAITIRKFSRNPLTLKDLVSFGTLNDDMAELLCQAVSRRLNIVISGGTGSGKTTLLNILSAQIGNTERIVTIEDAAELQMVQPHVVSLEARPANTEGKGAITIRDLVRNALRMRPDRIVVGECRGAEALDMLQAMNTGHDGSLTTTHANSPVEAISRLETLCLMAGLQLPARSIREQIAGAVDLIVQQCRFADGSRKITSIAEVTGIDESGQVTLMEIFRHDRRSGSAEMAAFVASGWLPRFLLQGESA